MILTPEQINELVDRLKPLGCNKSSYEDSVNILYKYYTVFEYRSRFDAESPLNLQPDSITFAGIRKLRELHKKYCPTIRKGNWKHLSIKQLEKFLEEFDRFDKEIILALKKKLIKTKVADIEKDF